MDTSPSNAALPSGSETQTKGPEVGVESASGLLLNKTLTGNDLSQDSAIPVTIDHEASDGDEGFDSEDNSQLLNASARTLARWTAPELDKLAELLNARRDLEASNPTLIKLKQPELFALAAEQLSSLFPTQRSGQAAFVHWTRHGDKSSAVFRFNPVRTSQEKKAARASALAASKSTPKSKRLASASSELKHEDSIDNDDDIEEEDEEDSFVAPAKVRKSLPKNKAAKTEASAKKRTVFRFTPQQREVLQKAAMVDMRPELAVKQKLADDLGVDFQKVKQFFTNAQAGNYSFSKHLKNIAATDDSDNDFGGMVNSPSTVDRDTPDARTPELEPHHKPESAKPEPAEKKRKQLSTSKASEAESSKKPRYSNASMGYESTDADEPLPLPKPRIRTLSAKKAAAVANSLQDGSSQTPTSASRLKQSHVPSPLGATDAMDIDTDDQNASSSNRTSPEALAAVESTQPHIPTATNSEAESAATEPTSKFPIMVKRTAGPLSTSVPVMSFDPEQAKRISEMVVRETRAEMTELQLFRANNPPNSPYDMVPIPKAVAQAPAVEPAVQSLESNTKKWQDEKAKLQAEVRHEVQVRKNLYQGNLSLKARYNSGNTKLKELSVEYKNKDYTDEQKLALTKEFEKIQALMIADRDAYNTTRAHSEDIKNSVDAKQLRIKELKKLLIEAGRSDRTERD